MARSTVCDANAQRPALFFQELFSCVYQRCAANAPNHKFRFKSKLFSLDSTTISLCLSLFPWAKFRRQKAGIKLHTLLDHDGYIPAFVALTEAKVNDSKMAKTLNLPGGSIVVFDKAYNDYRWFHSLTGAGIFFVSRLKSNAVYRLVERRAVNKNRGVTSDHVIEIKRQNYVLRLRRIGYRDPESGRHFEFLTNNFRLSAKTIADIYKDRWRIELFFKEIKQNLHIKKFVGTSENAVIIQIYTALTVYLIVAWLKFLAKAGCSIQQLLQILQLNLMERLHLKDLMDSRRRKQNLLNDMPLLSYFA